MILTDREIQTAIQNKQIIVHPTPGLDAYSSTSLDLTLSKSLRIWKTETPAVGVEVTICPATDGYKYIDAANALSETKEIGAEGFVINPHVFLLGWTEENVELPIEARLAARVEGKSSLARLGIGIHITAPNNPCGF